MERALSLDIEVAARPGGDLAAARADLDAFTDVAATFAGDQPEPTLGAFLAYLSAAQQEEFGLETGRVGESDTVKLLTVHAAKGLQWPAVFIPGLAAGEKSQVFPARPRVPTRWTDNPRLIPFPLRGDKADLPELRALDADSLAEFNEACAARDLAEERRLALCRGDQGRVLARLLRLLVGRRDLAARPVGVPHRGPRRVRGRRGNGDAVGGPAGRRRGQPAARRGGRGGLAGDSGRPALRGGRGGGGSGRRCPPRGRGEPQRGAARQRGGRR